MSKTSTEVKRRYNAKTYSNMTIALRKEEFARFESLRGEMSRAEFIRIMMDGYEKGLTAKEE